MPPLATPLRIDNKKITNFWLMLKKSDINFEVKKFLRFFSLVDNFFKKDDRMAG